jgi:hypothetical protein
MMTVVNKGDVVLAKAITLYIGGRDRGTREQILAHVRENPDLSGCTLDYLDMLLEEMVDGGLLHRHRTGGGMGPREWYEPVRTNEEIHARGFWTLNHLGERCIHRDGEDFKPEPTPQAAIDAIVADGAEQDRRNAMKPTGGDGVTCLPVPPPDDVGLLRVVGHLHNLAHHLGVVRVAVHERTRRFWTYHGPAFQNPVEHVTLGAVPAGSDWLGHAASIACDTWTVHDDTRDDLDAGFTLTNEAAAALTALKGGQA